MSAKNVTLDWTFCIALSSEQVVTLLAFIPSYLCVVPYIWYDLFYIKYLSKYEKI